MIRFDNRLRSAAVSFSALLALGAGASSAFADGPDVPQPSPHARVEQRVGVTDLSVEYASPGVKGRKIWGALVPQDKVWRTGANAATKFVASRDFVFGDKPVKAGAYALYTIPGKDSWTVILNSNVNVWGTVPPEEKNDVARVTVKAGALPAVRERMTFLFSDTTDETTALDLEWEKVRVRVPIKVDTKAHVAANIDEALGAAWRPHFIAARWLLDNGGDLDRALGFVDKSIAIQATWWNHWVRAQILGKKGNKAEAVAAAKQSMELGQGDAVFEGFFKDSVTKAIAGWK